MESKETPEATEPKAKQPKVAAPKSFDTAWTVFTKWSQGESTDAQVVGVWESRDAGGRFVAQVTQPTTGRLTWTVKTTAARAKTLDGGEATTIGGAVRGADRAARKVLKQRLMAERAAAKEAARPREDETPAEPVGTGNGADLLKGVEDRVADEMGAMR